MKAAWKALQEAYRRAMSRWRSARSNLRDVRPDLADVNRRLGLKAGDDRGNGKVRDEVNPQGPTARDELDRILEKRGRLVEHKKSLEDQVRNRKEIKQRLKKKTEAAHEAFLAAADDPEVVAPGVVIADAPWNPNRRPCAEGFVPILNRAWENGWRGILNSGWRSPEYSESLCVAMCGQKSCPGRCAGRASRHSQTPWQNGAIDVSDQYKFDQVTPELFNALGAADPWHMSTTGH